jgi:flagellar protein FliJ
MKRSRRFAPVQRVVDENERQRALRLADAGKRLVEAEAKLSELRRYHDEYSKEFTARAGAGIGTSGLRDYQSFLARLTGAIRAQALLVEQTRAEREGTHASWKIAATRAMAVGHVIERWQGEERRKLEQREQGESDERAQHSAGTNPQSGDKH